MKVSSRFQVLVLTIVGSLLFSSCLSFLFANKDAYGKNEQDKNVQATKVFAASGESTSLLTAINDAKISAIQKAVVYLIGVHEENQNQQKLREVLYNTKYPNAYVENDKMQVLQKQKVGENYFCQIQIPVKLKELSDFLSHQGIGNNELSEKDISQNFQNETTPTQTKSPDELLAQEKKLAQEAGRAEYLETYLNNMTYMVYGAENSSADSFLLKSAVQMANSYLISNGNRTVDFTEIEKLKKDNARVYQESQASGISLIQWIAQNLNADVYLEIDATTEGSSSYGGEYYGSAKVTVKIFNPSTGELLGAIPYSSPKTYSRVSEYDAQSNALQSTIYKVLPLVQEQSKIMLAKAYANGIRYELIINGAENTKIITLFRTELKKYVNEVRTLSLSAKQARFAVFSFSSVDEVLNLVYDTATKVPGCENLELTMLRGKSLTFALNDF